MAARVPEICLACGKREQTVSGVGPTTLGVWPARVKIGRNFISCSTPRFPLLLFSFFFFSFSDFLLFISHANAMPHSCPLLSPPRAAFEEDVTRVLQSKWFVQKQRVQHLAINYNNTIEILLSLTCCILLKLQNELVMLFFLLVTIFIRNWWKHRIFFLEFKYN